MITKNARTGMAMDEEPDVLGYAIPEMDTLSALDLFRDLRPEDLSRLQGLLRRRIFPAGAELMATEQPGDVAYVIVDGAVKVHIESPDGTDVILAILGPGEVLGEMSVVDSLGRSATVVTLEESTLLWIDRTSFWECLKAIPEMTFNLTRIISRRLRLANERIEALATLDVFGRVARHILALAQEYGETTPDGDVRIPIRLTQSDLASLVSASRVRVNQVLMAYKRRKWISVDRNYRTTVHERAALAERCQ